MPRRRKRQEETEQEPALETNAPIAKNLPVIKVVGISTSGKSTLVRALRGAGYDARPVSQEHSNVPDLWQQFDRPSYLIFLYASLEDQRARRQDVTWSAAAHQEEVLRLSHAREHADLRIDTSGLTAEGVFRIASTYLARQRVRRANHPLAALPATGSAQKRQPPDSTD